MHRRFPRSTLTALLGGLVACSTVDWVILSPRRRWTYASSTSNPRLPVSCNVSYSISAAIPEDQYIAVGFKGLAYRAMIQEERPNYFGMSTDEIDEQHTTSVIVLGYVSAAGGCVREMKAESYVGRPTDVKGNPHLSGASVERTSGLTVVRFTIEQHAGRNAAAITTFFNKEQVSMRVMYAIGGIGGDGDCEADIQMHSQRGVSPLGWFDQNPKCAFDPAELGGNATAMDASVIV